MTPRHRSPKRLLALVLLALLTLGADDCGEPDGTIDEPGPGAFTSDAARHLPLEIGTKWVLRSDKSDAPVRLEVVRRAGDAFVIEFENPWSFEEIEIIQKDGRFYRVGIQPDDYPGDTTRQNLYWDLTADEGAGWSNALGRMGVEERGKKVEGKGVAWDAVQIKEKSSKGHVLFWTFAPDVGFVQFGEGSWAFVLDPSSSVLPGSKRAARPKPAPTAPPVAPPMRQPGGVMIGLAATLPVGEAYTVRNRIKRFEMSVDAGTTYIYLSPKWDEVEPKEGRFDFNEIDFWVTQSRRTGVPIVVNLRIVDTGETPRPKDLRGEDWDDEELRDRLLAVIDRLVPRLKDTTTYFLIGNEISSYFKHNKDEADEFAALWKQGAARIKKHAPKARVSASVTADSLTFLQKDMPELDAAIDYLALTYYPLNSDFTMRPPTDAPKDFRKMLKAAKGRPILIQEVGYSSSPINKSSPEAQAEFYAQVFDQLERNSDQIIGANFLWMSDLSDELVDEFGRYYRLPNADIFKAYLKYLGIFDDKNRPKPAWEVFRKRAPAFQSS